MSKDPAVLWYWNDWNSGTSTLSRFLKGCYMDLLHAQFNSGPLSLEEVKIVLGADFGAAWPTLLKKFSKNPEGLFFNERAEAEKIKRKAFTQSRIKNLTKKPLMDVHMENNMGSHMDNVNRNTLEDLGKSENPLPLKVEKVIPEMEEFLSYCKEFLKSDYPGFEFSLKSKYESWIENGWKDGNNSKIKGWKVKIKNTVPYLKKTFVESLVARIEDHPNHNKASERRIFLLKHSNMDFEPADIEYLEKTGRKP